MITFALPKGRLAEKSAELLEKCGVDTAVLQEDTRKLVLESADKKYGFFLVKPADVPAYVEAGVADLGIVGKDTLIEEGRDLYEMLDLKMASAVFRSRAIPSGGTCSPTRTCALRPST